jgi:hypothetical protein
VLLFKRLYHHQDTKKKLKTGRQKVGGFRTSVCVGVLVSRCCIFRIALRTDPPILACFVNAFCPFRRQEVPDGLRPVPIISERKDYAEAVSQRIFINKQLVLRLSTRKCMVERAAGRRTGRGAREPEECSAPKAYGGDGSDARNGGANRCTQFKSAG